MTKISANVKRRFDMEHRILDKLAKRMPVGEDQVGMAYPQVAEDIGEPVHAVLAAKRTMEDAGILKTRIDYPKGKSGRVGIWTLMMPVDLAHEEMTREHHRQLARPSLATQRKRDRKARETGESILRYVSGDENELKPFEAIRSLRRDEAMAMIEAARQYRARIDVVENKIRELQENGIEVSPDAFSLKRDDRLETIALVVPAFDALIRERDRFEEQAGLWASRITDVQNERDHYKREYEGAKRALEQRVREDVVRSQGKPA